MDVNFEWANVVIGADTDAVEFAHKNNYRRYVVKYQNLHVFDIENVTGVTMNRALEHYRVVDWFDCKGLYNLTCRQITTDDDFINKLVFFKTRRIDGDQKYLDLLCESFLKDFDYSDTMARFKVKDILQKHLKKKVKMKLWKREVYPVYKCLQKNT